MNTNSMDALTLFACFELGVLCVSDLREFAIAHLEEPIDPLILEMSLCDKTDSECIRLAALRLFDEHGYGDIAREHLLRIVTIHVCNKIVAGSVAVKEGARIIVDARTQARLHDFHEVDPFVYALSEMEERPQDEAFFTGALMEEAKEWAFRSRGRS